MRRLRLFRRRLRLPTVAFGTIGVIVAFIAAPPSRPATADGALKRAELVQKLVAAYPGTAETGPGGALLVRGREVAVSDIRTAGTVQERMSIATIGDQFSIPYPMGCPLRVPGADDDPGRLRNDAFFRAMYGSSRSEVAKTLVPVKWFGSTLQATTTNDVDKRLAAVARDLSASPALLRYLTKPGGGYNWRKIAGENVLSMHSFGIAVDINVRFSDYWRWSGGVKEYRNRIPCEIGEVFERHGFIWGAKWFHFDTMHFEYRPELLA